MNKNNKKMQKIQKELEHIYKKEVVDIPNDDLKTISQSLEIINNNFLTYEIQIKSGMKQEEELYKNLDTSDVDSQKYFIQQTYGAASTISEEAQVNFDYTTNLASKFESILNKK